MSASPDIPAVLPRHFRLRSARDAVVRGIRRRPPEERDVDRFAPTVSLTATSVCASRFPKDAGQCPSRAPASQRLAVEHDDRRPDRPATRLDHVTIRANMTRDVASVRRGVIIDTSSAPSRIIAPLLPPRAPLAAVPRSSLSHQRSSIPGVAGTDVWRRRRRRHEAREARVDDRPAPHPRATTDARA